MCFSLPLSPSSTQPRPSSPFHPRDLPPAPAPPRHPSRRASYSLPDYSASSSWTSLPFPAFSLPPPPRPFSLSRLFLPARRVAPRPDATRRDATQRWPQNAYNFFERATRFLPRCSSIRGTEPRYQLSRSSRDFGERSKKERVKSPASSVPLCSPCFTLFLPSIALPLGRVSCLPLALDPPPVTSLSWDAILPSDNQGPPLSFLYIAAPSLAFPTHPRAGIQRGFRQGYPRSRPCHPLARVLFASPHHHAN